MCVRTSESKTSFVLQPDSQTGDASWESTFVYDVELSPLIILRLPLISDSPDPGTIKRIDGYVFRQTRIIDRHEYIIGATSRMQTLPSCLDDVTMMEIETRSLPQVHARYHDTQHINTCNGLSAQTDLPIINVSRAQQRQTENAYQRAFMKLLCDIEENVLAFEPTGKDFVSSIRQGKIQCAVVFLRPVKTNQTALIHFIIGNAHWRHEVSTVSVMGQLQSGNNSLRLSCSCQQRCEFEPCMYRHILLDDKQLTLKLKSITERTVIQESSSEGKDEWSVLQVPSIKRDDFKVFMYSEDGT